MESIFDLSTAITALKKERKFEDGLNLFKQHRTKFAEEQISKNNYLIADIVTCLRNTNQLDAGFKFLDKYKIEINENTPSFIINSYGWLLYSKYKAENSNLIQVTDSDFLVDEEDELSSGNNDYTYDKSELLVRIENLLQLLIAQNNSFNNTLISNLFEIVLKSEKKKNAPNWKLVYDFCSKINPEVLSKEVSTIQVERKGRLRDMELASSFENWYSYITKATFKLGIWDECMNYSEKALEVVKNPHYSNDVWFTRRYVLSKKMLGNSETTIKDLEDILKKKKEWFIQKELADLYLEKGDFAKSFQYSMDAINNFGELKFKVQLLDLLGKIYKLSEKLDISFKFYSLSKLIREAEEWKIPNALYTELSTFNQEEIKLSEIKNLERELSSIWRKYSNTPEPRRNRNSSNNNSDTSLKGYIKRILNNNDQGKNGFVKSNDNEYYFTVGVNYNKIDFIKEGAKVEFTLFKNQKGKDQARISKVL